MSSASKFLLPMLLFAVVLGCSGREKPPRPVPGSLSCRIVADSVDDSSLVALALAEAGRFVKQNGRTIGAWVPIADPSSAAADVDRITNAVMRDSVYGREILVLVSDRGMTDQDVAFVIGRGVDLMHRPVVTLRLTEEGAERSLKFTGDNAQRHLAIIVGDVVRSVPRIQEPITEQFIIVSPTQAESDEIMSALLEP